MARRIERPAESWLLRGRFAAAFSMLLAACGASESKGGQPTSTTPASSSQTSASAAVAPKKGVRVVFWVAEGDAVAIGKTLERFAKVLGLAPCVVMPNGSRVTVDAADEPSAMRIKDAALEASGLELHRVLDTPNPIEDLTQNQPEPATWVPGAYVDHIDVPIAERVFKRRLALFVPAAAEAELRQFLSGEVVRTALPQGSRLVATPTREPKFVRDGIAPVFSAVLIDATPSVTSAMLLSAKAIRDPVNTKQWRVALQWNQDGTDALRAVTRQWVGRRIALVAGNTAQAVPVVLQELTDGAMMTMERSDDDAERDLAHLAEIVSRGPLPGRLQLESMAKL